MNNFTYKYRTRSCKPPGGGLAGKCAKVVGGGLHEGGGSTIYSFFLEGGGLREILSKDMGVAYTSEYGTYFTVVHLK